MFRRLTLAAILALTALSAGAAPARPTVVELFTSQGCSSCPPADALLAELAQRKDVIALGFHVDYWDRLGWRDPLSTPGSTERQHAYAQSFGLHEVYTPQMVVDGAHAMVGSDRGAVLGLLRTGSPLAEAPVTFAADFKSVAVDAGQGRGRVLLVRYLRRRTTSVRAGENAGRSAEDVNGVIALTVIGDWSGSAVQFDIESAEPGEGIAILVQSADGRILGAAATPAS